MAWGTEPSGVFKALILKGKRKAWAPFVLNWKPMLPVARFDACAGIFNVTQETMMKHVSTLVLSLCMALAGHAYAADPAQSRDSQQTQTQAQERVYGYELMTPQERNEYQARMRATKTEQEREALRLEHHKQMQERAKAQGKTLPDMPAADRGPGMGPSGGKGTGPGGRGGYGY